jgi:hypothetical protein
VKRTIESVRRQVADVWISDTFQPEVAQALAHRRVLDLPGAVDQLRAGVPDADLVLEEVHGSLTVT